MTLTKFDQSFADDLEGLAMVNELTEAALRENELLARIEALKRERDLWMARAMAMFWKLPDEMTVADLQDDAKRALEFLG